MRLNKILLKLLKSIKMSAFQFLYYKYVDENIKYCKYETCIIKYDENSELNQPYFFRKCRYINEEFYSHKAYKQENNRNLVSLILKTIKNGPSQIGTASLLKISPKNLLKRISEIIIKFKQSVISINNTCEIEVRNIFIGDEINISTSLLYRLFWIKYPLKREITRFYLGDSRTNKTL